MPHHPIYMIESGTGPATPTAYLVPRSALWLAHYLLPPPRPTAYLVPRSARPTHPRWRSGEWELTGDIYAGMVTATRTTCEAYGSTERAKRLQMA